jgi:hypothetical protein
MLLLSADADQRDQGEYDRDNQRNKQHDPEAACNRDSERRANSQAEKSYQDNKEDDQVHLSEFHQFSFASFRALRWSASIESATTRRIAGTSLAISGGN